MTVTRTDSPGASDSASSGQPVLVDDGDGDEVGPDAPDPAAARRSTPPEIVVVALVAVAIGVAFRFVARTPLWLDEALSVNIAQLPPGQIVDALRHDGHPPLYYLLLHVWMQVFGQGDVAVRALSGVLSVATLPMAWLAGQRRGGPMLGWVLVSVLAVSTFAARYATETRMYSLVMLLVFVGYLVLDDIVRRGRATWWRLLALGALSGVLLLTHYWSMFLLGALCLTLAWRWWRTRSPEALRAVVAIVVGSIVCFLPWLGVFAYQSAHTGTPWAAPFRPTTTVAVAFLDFHTVDSNFRDPITALMVTTALLVLGLFGVAVDRRTIQLDLRTVRQVRYEAIVAALTLGFGIAAGWLSRSAFASRYAAVLYPLLLLVVAAGVTRFVSRPVRFGVLAVYLALNLIGVLYGALVYQRTEARVVAAAINAKANVGDVVVYCPDQLGPAGQREVRGDLRQVVYPTLGAPELVDWVDYGGRNAAADPEAVARRVLDLAGPEHAIFVAWAGSYKTLEKHCERFVNAISAQRPISTTLVTDDSTKYFEHENLSYFGPAPSS